MKIFVAGGTGFVGSYLVPYLLGQGHSVKLLVRPEVERSYPIAEGVEVIEGNPVSEGPWWEQLAECDTAINLVGHTHPGSLVADPEDSDSRESPSHATQSCERDTANQTVHSCQHLGRGFLWRRGRQGVG